MPVQFVIQHFEQLVVAYLILDVDRKDALEGAHNILEGEDVLFVSFVWFEFAFHHAQSLNRNFADVFDPLRVFKLFDFFSDS